MRILTLSTVFSEEKPRDALWGVEVFRDVEDLLTHQPQLWEAECQFEIASAEVLRDTKTRELRSLIEELGGDVPVQGAQWFCEEDGCWRYLSWAELPERD